MRVPLPRFLDLPTDELSSYVDRGVPCGPACCCPDPATLVLQDNTGTGTGLECKATPSVHLTAVFHP